VADAAADDPAADRALPGGRISGTARRGATVRRPMQPWTPAVQSLLRNLEDPVLADVGAWLRQLHDATATFVPPEGATWFAGQVWHAGLVMGHHDAAPYNAVWPADRLVGFVDWDTAGPSSRELDLAFSALAWVPLSPPNFVAPQGFTDVAGRSRGLRLLLDAYGYAGDRTAFGAAVAGRARVNAAGIRRLAATGEPTYRALLPVAQDFDRAARYVESLPDAFWR
jgi:Phosphotransferase enzyme family